MEGVTRGRPSRDYDSEMERALQTLSTWRKDTEDEDTPFDVHSYFTELQHERPSMPRRTSETDDV